MAIFVLSDLHLSTNDQTNKSMDVFGNRWQDYISKIQRNWNALVTNEDTVVIPGDISWATRLEEARADLAFLNSLNGKKLLGKGNHDFWWATSKKMKEFFANNGFDTLDILYNNAHVVEDRIICGTRGWFPDENRQVVVGDVEYDKIVNREVGRLQLSINAARELWEKEKQVSGRELEICVFLHFPPVWSDFVMQQIVDVLTEFGIKRVYFGHIHSNYNVPLSFKYQNIEFILTSSDFLSFYPLKI